MPQGTIVASFVEGGQACLAVRVVEGPGQTIEYIGRVPLDEAWQAASNPARRALLVAAVKAARDRQQPAPVDLGIGGSVQL